MTEKTESGPDFEKTLNELEKLVEKLEAGDLSLDESLTGFKQGVELSRQCQETLDSAQQTVEQLIDPDDKESVSPFERDA
jgi:exodeoxyribonuclease VII small subunit